MLKLEIIGNLGADPEVKIINEREYVTMSIAHSESTKDEQGNKVESTVWVSALWNGNGGNLLPYLKKGTKVFVRGNMGVKVYQTKSGTHEAGINVMVGEIQLCGSARAEDGNTSLDSK